MPIEDVKGVNYHDFTVVVEVERGSTSINSLLGYLELMSTLSGRCRDSRANKAQTPPSTLLASRLSLVSLSQPSRGRNTLVRKGVPSNEPPKLSFSHATMEAYPQLLALRVVTPCHVVQL